MCTFNLRPWPCGGKNAKARGSVRMGERGMGSEVGESSGDDVRAGERVGFNAAVWCKC